MARRGRYFRWQEDPSASLRPGGLAFGGRMRATGAAQRLTAAGSLSGRSESGPSGGSVMFGTGGGSVLRPRPAGPGTRASRMDAVRGGARASRMTGHGKHPDAQNSLQ